MRLAHLALNLRQLRHARLKLLPGDRTWRLVQLLYDPGERESGAGAMPLLRRLSLSLALAFPGRRSARCGSGVDSANCGDGDGPGRYCRMSSMRSMILAQRVKLISGRWSTTTVEL